MLLFEDVAKVYRTGRGAVRALDGVSVRIEEGECVLLRGPSGSGKTTFLLAAGAMLRPTAGRIAVAGSDLYAMSGAERARFRAETIGFVFQTCDLVPYLSVLENVLLAGGRRGGGGKGKRRGEAGELLERLRLSRRSDHLPGQLSAGERQRAAIARAFFGRPRVILADEPTGNLDEENAAEVEGYLAAFHGEGGTVVVASHGAAGGIHAGRVLELREGRLQEATARGDRIKNRDFLT